MTFMESDPRYDLRLRTKIYGTLDTERLLDSDPAIQRLLDEEQLVSWLLSMGPWDVIAHLTWRDRVGHNKDGSVKLMGISEWSAARGVERFMSDLPGVSYFYSVEKNPSRDGHHAHMLWGDCHTVYRKEQWAKWLKLHGRARIEPVRSDRDVAGYASKYVMKLPCWWNINLRWHRIHQVNGTSSSAELLRFSSSEVDWGNPRRENESQGGGPLPLCWRGAERIPEPEVPEQRKEPGEFGSAPAPDSREITRVVRWQPGGPGLWEADYVVYR